VSLQHRVRGVPAGITTATDRWAIMLLGTTAVAICWPGWTTVALPTLTAAWRLLSWAARGSLVSVAGFTVIGSVFFGYIPLVLGVDLDRTSAVDAYVRWQLVGLAAFLLWGNQKRFRADLTPVRTRTDDGQQSTRLFAALCGLGVLLASAAFLVRHGELPILAADADEARQSALHGGAALFILAASLGLACVVLLLSTHGSLRSQIGLISLVGVAAATGLGLAVGNRGTLVAIGMLAVALMLRKGGSLGLRVLVIAISGLLALTAVVVVGGLRNPDIRGEAATFYVSSFVNRASADTLVGSRIFELVDARGPYGPKAVAWAFAPYLPGTQPNLGQQMKSELGLEFSGGGVTTPVAAEAIILGPLLGVALQVLCVVATTLGIARLARSRLLVFRVAGVSALPGIALLPSGGVLSTLSTFLVPTVAVLCAVAWFSSHEWRSAKHVQRHKAM